MAKPNQRSGFTLIELLVVIAIVGLLISLLALAVSAVRNASRRMACANNLKQIGLAFQNYEALHKVMPCGSGAMGHGPFVCILPFIEQSAIYDSIDFSQDVDGNPIAQKARIALYRCPATSRQDAPRTDYVLNRGTTLALHRDSPWFVEERAYQSSASLANGTSHTALIAETCPRIAGQVKGSLFSLEERNTYVIATALEFADECDRTSWNAPLDNSIDNGEYWFGAGVANYYHIFQPNYKSCANGGLVQDSLYTTNSMHSGGVNVLYADGHVDFATNSIDRKVWSQVGSRFVISQ